MPGEMPQIDSGIWQVLKARIVDDVLYVDIWHIVPVRKTTSELKFTMAPKILVTRYRRYFIATHFFEQGTHTLFFVHTSHTHTHTHLSYTLPHTFFDTHTSHTHFAMRDTSGYDPPCTTPTHLSYTLPHWRTSLSTHPSHTHTSPTLPSLPHLPHTPPTHTSHSGHPHTADIFHTPGHPSIKSPTTTHHHLTRQNLPFFKCVVFKLCGGVVVSCELYSDVCVGEVSLWQLSMSSM